MECGSKAWEAMSVKLRWERQPLLHIVQGQTELTTVQDCGMEKPLSDGGTSAELSSLGQQYMLMGCRSTKSLKSLLLDFLNK